MTPLTCSCSRSGTTSAIASVLMRDAKFPQMRDFPLTQERLWLPRRATGKADQIVKGLIATGVPGQPTASGMAVKDGVIVGLGSADDLDGLTGADTEIVEVGDRVVVPGFIEPHMHLWATVMVDRYLDCSQIENPTFDDVVAKIKDLADKAEPGAWVQGQLFDPSLFPGEPELTTDILDRVSPNNPVAVLNASMHYLYVNSKAFELAGVTAETPDPAGGRYYREDGKLTGVVGEMGAILPFLAVMPHLTQEEILQDLRGILAKAASQGVTSVREALLGAIMQTQEFGVLQQINAAARLPTRVSTAQSSLLGNQAWADAGITPGAGDDMVRAGAWKIVSDGSNQGRSGYLRTNYLGTDDHGHPNMDLEALTALVKEGHDAGWQIMLHANGDAAIDESLNAYEAVLKDAGAHDQRHRIEHSSLAHPEQLQRMKELGISPSFLMNHVYFWGRAFRDNIVGPEVADNLDRAGSAAKAGLQFSFHSDYSVSHIQPLLSARTGVLRNMRDGGEILNPSECVDAETALRAVTVDAAWQIHGDDRGSLEVGKKADYAVLSANPWATDPSDWADISVHETRIDGTVAWSA